MAKDTRNLVEKKKLRQGLEFLYKQQVVVTLRMCTSAAGKPSQYLELLFMEYVSTRGRPASAQSGHFCHIQIILNASQLLLSEAPQDSCTTCVLASFWNFRMLQHSLSERTKAKWLFAHPQHWARQTTRYNKHLHFPPLTQLQRDQALRWLKDQQSTQAHHLNFAVSSVYAGVIIAM